jgi:hypothetical protein
VTRLQSEVESYSRRADFCRLRGLPVSLRTSPASCADARIHRNAGLHARNAAAPRGAARKPGNPGRADGARRAALSRRVPVRSQGRRSAARTVVARAARRDPAGPPSAQRRRVREDLDAAGLAARGALRRWRRVCSAGSRRDSATGCSSVSP